MQGNIETVIAPAAKSRLDRALALFTDDSGGSSATRSDVVVRTADGAMRTVLTTKAPDLVYGVAWSADDHSLLLLRSSARQSRSSTLWRLDLTSGHAVEFEVDLAAMRDIRISPAGRAVSFTAGQFSRHVWVLEHFLPAAPTPARPANPPDRHQ